MGRAFQIYQLPKTGAHVQTTTGAGNSEQTITAPEDAVACFISMRGQNAYVTWNNTAASSANGLELISGAQPLFLPLGFPYVLRYIGAGTDAIINILWLA